MNQKKAKLLIKIFFLIVFPFLIYSSVVNSLTVEKRYTSSVGVKIPFDELSSELKQSPWLSLTQLAGINLDNLSVQTCLNNRSTFLGETVLGVPPSWWNGLIEIEFKNGNKLAAQTGATDCKPYDLSSISGLGNIGKQGSTTEEFSFIIQYPYRKLVALFMAFGIYLGVVLNIKSVYNSFEKSLSSEKYTE